MAQSSNLIDKALQFVTGIKNNVTDLAPNPHLTSPIPSEDQITKQLGAHIASPIPASDVAPHRAGLSPLSQGIQDFGNSAVNLARQYLYMGPRHYINDQLQKPIAQAAETYYPTPTPYQGNPQESIPPESEQFAKTAMPIFDIYGIPPAVGMGQFAAEGRMHGIGANRNNYYNIGGYDGQEAQMPSYDSEQAGIEAYAKLIAKDPRYKAAFEARNDPAKMIQLIQDAGYAGDPSTYKQRATNGYDSYAEFVRNTPEFRKYYIKQ